MVLHKIINGVKVDCTPEEEEKIKKEWEDNIKKHEISRARMEEESILHSKLLNSAKDKLISLGLTNDEINALLKEKITKV